MIIIITEKTIEVPKDHLIPYFREIKMIGTMQAGVTDPPCGRWNKETRDRSVANATMSTVSTSLRVFVFITGPPKFVFDLVTG